MLRTKTAAVLAMVAMGLASCGDTAGKPAAKAEGATGGGAAGKATATVAVDDGDPILEPCDGCVVHTVKITNKWPKPIAKIHFQNDHQPEWARSRIDGTLDSGETEAVKFDSWENICNFFIRAQFADGTKQIIMHDACGFDAATFEPAT